MNIKLPTVHEDGLFLELHLLYRNQLSKDVVKGVSIMKVLSQPIIVKVRGHRNLFSCIVVSIESRGLITQGSIHAANKRCFLNDSIWCGRTTDISQRAVMMRPVHQITNEVYSGSARGCHARELLF